MSFITYVVCNWVVARGESRTAATSKMKRFVIIANSWKPLTIITKRSIFDVAAGLDPPLVASVFRNFMVYSESVFNILCIKIKHKC